ncbi:MAG: hypothetical protein WCP87_04930, partial [Atribacterota bacterium]
EEIGEKIPSEPPEKPIFRLETRMHTAAINSIDTDTNNSFIVTGSDDKTIRVWDRSTGKLIRILRPPLGDQNEGRINAVALSPDGATIACGVWTGKWEETEVIYLFDRENSTLVGTITGLAGQATHLVFSNNGQYLATTLAGKNGIRLYDLMKSQLVSSDNDYGSDSIWVDINQQGVEKLVTTCFDGSLRLYHISPEGELRLMVRKNPPGGTQPFSAEFSPDGSKIAVGYYDSTRVDVLSSEDLSYQYSPDNTGVNNGNLNIVAWSFDGQSLYAGGRFHLSETDIAILQWSQQGRGPVLAIPVLKNTLTQMAPLQDGSMAFAGFDPAWGIFNPSGHLSLFVPSSLPDFRDALEHFLCSPDASLVELRDYGSQVPFRFSLSQRRFLSPSDELAQNLPALKPPTTESTELTLTGWWNEFTPRLHGKPLSLADREKSRCLAIAPGGHSFILGTEWYLRCFDTSGQESWNVLLPGPAWGVNVSDDGKVVAALGDGTVHWYRLSDGQELLALFPQPKQKLWAIWTPEGYFDTSEGGDELMGWHMNQGKDREALFHPASRFFEKFYRLDLFAQILKTNQPDQKVLAA